MTTLNHNQRKLVVSYGMVWVWWTNLVICYQVKEVMLSKNWQLVLGQPDSIWQFYRCCPVLGSCTVQPHYFNYLTRVQAVDVTETHFGTCDSYRDAWRRTTTNVPNKYHISTSIDCCIVSWNWPVFIKYSNFLCEARRVNVGCVTQVNLFHNKRLQRVGAVIIDGTQLTANSCTKQRHNSSACSACN